MSTTASEIMSAMDVRTTATSVRDAREHSSAERPILVLDEWYRPVGLIPPEKLEFAPANATLGEVAKELPAVTIVHPDTPVETLIGARSVDSDVAWFIVHRGGAYLGAVRPSSVDRIPLRRPREEGGEIDAADEWERVSFRKGANGADLAIGGLFGEIIVLEASVSFLCEPGDPEAPHSYPLAEARKYYNLRKRVICPLHHREMVRHVGG
jgi:hypothetical protein